MAKHIELLQGTLDMLVLKAVSLQPPHGYGVPLRIQQVCGDRLHSHLGSLYPARYRLEHQGRIDSEWSESENRRKAKYYRLTAAGRRLKEEATNRNLLAETIAGVPRMTQEEP